MRIKTLYAFLLLLSSCFSMATLKGRIINEENIQAELSRKKSFCESIVVPFRAAMTVRQDYLWKDEYNRFIVYIKGVKKRNFLLPLHHFVQEPLYHQHYYNYFLSETLKVIEEKKIKAELIFSEKETRFFEFKGIFLKDKRFSDKEIFFYFQSIKSLYNLFFSC